VFPFRRAHRPRTGDQVEAKLPTGKYWPQHARRSVRGVVQGNALLYRSSVTGDPASLRLESLTRAGYKLQITQRP
jgi:hypothetical protein